MTIDITNTTITQPKKKIKEQKTEVANPELEIRRSFAIQTELTQTHSRLVALHASIQKYGLTRSLVAFADYDKSLSSAVPEVPALESLQHDRSVKNSTEATAALEGVIGKTYQNVRAAAQRVATSFKTLVKMQFGTLNVIEGEMRKIVGKIKEEHLSLNRERLEEKVHLPKYTELLQLLETIREYHEAIGKVYALEPPENGEQFYGWADKVHKLLQPYETVSAHVFGEKGLQGTNHGCVLHEDHYAPASLHSLGYDSIDKLEAIHRVFVDTKIALEKSKEFYERYDRILINWHVSDDSLHYAVKIEEIYNALIFDITGLYRWTRRWAPKAFRYLASCTEKAAA